VSLTLILFVTVDSKRKPPKEIDVNIKHLKLIWGLHQSVAEEHIRSASYLLQYKTSSSSFIARPVVVNLDQVPATDTSVEGSSSESNIPITDLMKKRKAPAFFDKSTSATGEVKKNKEDVPHEGTKNIDVSSSIAAKEAGKKPPVAPSKIVAISPSSDVIVISPVKTTSLAENAPSPLRRLKNISSEKPVEPTSQPSNIEGDIPTFVPSRSTVGLVRSWTIPGVQGIEDTLSREIITTLAAQHIASVIIFDLSL